MHLQFVQSPKQNRSGLKPEDLRHRNGTVPLALKPCPDTNRATQEGRIVADASAEYVFL